MNAIKNKGLFCNLLFSGLGISICIHAIAMPEDLGTIGPTTAVPFVIGQIRAMNAATDAISARSSARLNISPEFPVITKTMRPGRLIQKSTMNHQALVQSRMAMIGTDRFSHQWLSENYAHLSRANIPVMVVNVQSRNEFYLLMKAYPKLSFMPMNGDALARAMNVNIYPVILTTEGAIQ